MAEETNHEVEGRYVRGNGERPGEYGEMERNENERTKIAARTIYCMALIHPFIVGLHVESQ